MNLLCFLQLLTIAVTSLPTAHFVCSPANDVFLLLSNDPRQPFHPLLHPTLDAALASVAPGDSLLLLADGAAPASQSVSAAQWDALAASPLSGAYLELPSSLPGNSTAAFAPTPAWYYDRIVVRTNELAAAGLAPLDILMAQGASFNAYPVAPLVPTSALVFAHVAGSRTAVFGLPAAPTLNPVLFHAPAAPRALIAAVALSCLVQCRYAPLGRWQSVWNFIIGTVLASPPPLYAGFPAWAPRVAPSGPSPAQALAAASKALGAAPNAALRKLVAPPAAAAASRAAAFLRTGSGLLVTGNETLCPSPYAPPGGTISCMMEGFGSKMGANGSQAVALDARMDCSAESAMTFALRAAADAAAGAPQAEVAANAGAAAALLNFTWLYSSAAQGHNNASAPDFGILAWGVSGDGWAEASYGDDNARSIMGSMAAFSALRGLGVATEAWEEMALKSVLGNLRLASVAGFRPGRINYPDLAPSRGGWQRFHNSGLVYVRAASHFFCVWRGFCALEPLPSSEPPAPHVGAANPLPQENTSYPQPHYQAQMWAVFLLTFARTCAAPGKCFMPLLNAALRGLEDTMAHYPRGNATPSYASAPPLPPCTWSPLAPNTFASGCDAAACKGYSNLAAAQAACMQDPTCGAVTSGSGGAPPWQLRSGSLPNPSPSGEASYYITNSQACRPSHAPRFEWTEYLSEERARLLLPLAWLLRAEALAHPGAPQNATHLAWVRDVSVDYLASQHPSGGVLETLGAANQCDACPPASNDAYGTGEAPLIAATGEPFTDQLYGNNFALLSLLEAEAADPGGGCGAAALRMAAYLTAIQVRAGGALSYLDGAWMRGFDVEAWDFGGSAADWGWGPWSVETGWSATWASTGLLLVGQNGPPLWDRVVGAAPGGRDAVMLSKWCPVFFNETDVQC